MAPQRAWGKVGRDVKVGFISISAHCWSMCSLRVNEAKTGQHIRHKEFESHKINRDLWKDRIAQEIAQDNFMLWKCDVSDTETFSLNDYVWFYAVQNPTHVVVIYPRQRERARVLCWAILELPFTLFYCFTHPKI